MGAFRRSQGRETNRYGMLVSAPTGHRSMMFPVKRPRYGLAGERGDLGPVAALLERELAVLGHVLAEADAAVAGMQRSRSIATSGDRSSGLGKWRLGSTVRLRPGPNLKVRSCSGHSPPLSHTGQSSGWLTSSSSSTPSWASRTASVSVRTTMSAVTGVEQAVCRPRRPSTSTRHMRHAPMGAPMRGS